MPVTARFGIKPDQLFSLLRNFLDCLHSRCIVVVPAVPQNYASDEWPLDSIYQAVNDQILFLYAESIEQSDTGISCVAG